MGLEDQNSLIKSRSQKLPRSLAHFFFIKQQTKFLIFETKKTNSKILAANCSNSHQNRKLSISATRYSEILQNLLISLSWRQRDIEHTAKYRQWLEIGEAGSPTRHDGQLGLSSADLNQASQRYHPQSRRRGRNTASLACGSCTPPSGHAARVPVQKEGSQRACARWLRAQLLAGWWKSKTWFLQLATKYTCQATHWPNLLRLQMTWRGLECVFIANCRT